MKTVVVVLVVWVRVAAAQETVPLERPAGAVVRGNRAMVDWGSSQFVIGVEQVWEHFSGDNLEPAAREDAKRRDVDFQRATVERLGSRIVIREEVDDKPSLELVRFELVYIPWAKGATVVQLFADGDFDHWAKIAQTMIAKTTPTPAKSFVAFGSYVIEIPRQARIAFDEIHDGPNSCRIGKLFSREPLEKNRNDHLWDFEMEMSSGETVRCRADGRNAARGLGAILGTMRRRAKLDTLERIHALLE